MKRSILFLIFLIPLLSGCINTATKTHEQYLGRLVLDIPNSYEQKEVVNNVYDALSIRASQLQKYENFFPEEFPEKPARPKMQNKEMGIGMYSMNFINVKCGDNAWISISGQERGLKSAYGTKDLGSYRVCIYPYKKGYRVYVIGIYTYSEQNSILGSIAGAIKKGVTKATCDTDKVYNCWFNQVVKEIENKFTNAKVVRIDMPQR